VSESTAARRVLNHLMSERDLQDGVVQLARSLGLLVFHDYDSRRSESGFPDLVIVGPRGVAFIELKRQSGKLTTEQKAWGAALQASMGRYDARHSYNVFRPHDWHEGSVDEELRRLA